MKREDIKLGIVVRFRGSTWSVVAVKEHIDGDIYADLLTSGDYAKDIPIEKLEEHPLSKRCEDNTQKGIFFKCYDKVTEVRNKETIEEASGLKFVSLQKYEIEMFTESGEKVYIRIKSLPLKRSKVKHHNITALTNGEHAHKSIIVWRFLRFVRFFEIDKFRRSFFYKFINRATHRAFLIK